MTDSTALNVLGQDQIEVYEPKEEDISPEGLEIANAYLASAGNPRAVASTIGLPLEMVTKQLNRKEVRRYINTIFVDQGYNNRFKISNTLSNIIEKKLEEMEDTEMASQKDISELVALAHKFQLENRKLDLEERKLEQTAELAKYKERNRITLAGPVVNINDQSQFGGNYGNLLQQLLEMDNK